MKVLKFFGWMIGILIGVIISGYIVAEVISSFIVWDAWVAWDWFMCVRPLAYRLLLLGYILIFSSGYLIDFTPTEPRLGE